MSDHSNVAKGESQDLIQELTWALLDEQISEEEFEQLNSVLLRDNKSRETYVGCIQLHADLLAHFAAPADRAAKRESTPILGLDVPSLGFQSPSAEEAAS